MSAFALRCFLTMVVIVDPPGLVPVFVSLVGAQPAAERRQVARRAVLVAGGILFAFAVGGGSLFHYLGVRLDALRVAGGILLFRIAVDMVFAQRQRQTPEEEEEAHHREDVSVFPLAIPLIAGPGALTSILVLVASADGEPSRYGILVVMTALVLVLSYAALRLSGGVARVLGQTGINVVTRVLGIILAALAVQYVADGALALWRLAHGG